MFINKDYANHQLTKLRPFILENAVSYEWKTFKRDFEHKKTSIENTKQWLSTAWANYQKTTTGSPNPTFDLFPSAFLELMALAPKFNDESIVPETWGMDIPRIVTFYNSWQDITILGTIMVVFKQAAGPSCTFQELMDAKTKLWVLLNDNESTMSHITAQMAETAGTLRRKKFTTQEIKNISTLTENSLLPGSKLYELIQKRVSRHIQDGILGIKPDPELLAKNGLQTLSSEIDELTKKLVPVCNLHRAVYGNLYAATVLDIKNGTLKEMVEILKVLKA